MLWKTKDKATDSKGQEAKLLHNEKTGAFKIEFDGLSDSAQNVDILEEMADISQFPTFKGKVEQAYESDFLGYKDRCPECGAATEQKFSNFPYATQTRPRVMTGPMGWFCPSCPTVIIDDDLMRENMNPEVQYYGVFTVETGYSKEPTLFRMLNGKKSVYVLRDIEDSDIGGIANSVHQLDGHDFIRMSQGNNRSAPQRAQNRKTKRQKRQGRIIGDRYGAVS